MTSASICTLKPNISQDEAIRRFASAGLAALYWRVHCGPLQRIASVHVPFFLYRVRYEMGSASHLRLFAIDAMDGSLDLFEFPHVPADTELLVLETKNRLRPALSDAKAQEILRDKVLRIVFQQGFFKLRQPRIDVVRQSIDLHLPYWLAFYGRRSVYCRVIDAVRSRMEGSKASAFFEDWLAA